MAREVLPVAVVWGLTGLLVAPASLGLTVTDNTAFTRVNQNPWSSGTSFEREFIFDDARVTIPPVNLPVIRDPVGAAVDQIASFLGIGLSSPGLRFGASVSGSAGVEFGYYVSGGRMNLQYPGRSQLTFGDGATTTFVRGKPLAVGSVFQPGLTDLQLPASTLAAVAGAGYVQLALAGDPADADAASSGIVRISNPNFTTRFPYASAWADFDYNVNAGAFIEASATFTKYTRRFTFGDAGTYRLVEIDPGGISIADGPRVGLFDQEIGVPGFGSVKLSYPDVRVDSAPIAGNGTLRGTGRKPIISLQGDLEKLVPLVGPLLNNTVGPFGYSLLSVAGGPSLSLYQDFAFTPDPSVTLRFSETVLIRGTDGKLRPAETVSFDVGDPVEIVPVLNNRLTSTLITVEPTYHLNSTIRNETGFSLDVNFDFEVLSLTTPFGPVGPVAREDLDFNDLVRVPLYDNAFDAGLGSITGDTFQLDVRPVLQEISYSDFVLYATDPETGKTTAEFRFTYAGADGSFSFDEVTVGEIVEFFNEGNEEAPDLVFVADAPVIANLPNLGDVDLGQAFALSVGFNRQRHFLGANPSLASADGDVYLSELFEFPDGLVDIAADPILRGSNYFQSFNPVETFVGETEVETIPEPAVAGLAVLLLGMRRRRAAMRRSR